MTLGMRQIMVEVPDCITDEKAQYEINRIFSPDWIALWWHVSDVQESAENHMDLADAREILEEIKYRHDANEGVNWDVINYYVGEWRKEQEEENVNN
jgi:hypothetical protein